MKLIRTAYLFKPALFLIMLGLSTVAMAEQYRIAENWESRQSKVFYLFTKPVTALDLNFKMRDSQPETGTTVFFHLEKNFNLVSFVFENESQFGYSEEFGTGNVRISREISAEKAVSLADPEYHFYDMVIFIKDGRQDCFVRITPKQGQSLLAITLFGRTLVKDLVLPVSFKDIILFPFSRIKYITRDSVDWEMVLAQRGSSLKIQEIISSIRQYLGAVHYETDAAFDSVGTSVRIESGLPAAGGLNCTGFVKWIIDGFYYPLTGMLMSLEDIKKKLTEVRGNKWSETYEDTADPYFGLDAARNMAVKLAEARLGVGVTDSQRFDVRSVPYLSYLEDIGYKTEDLELLLYLAAVQNPQRIFIGSLNIDGGGYPARRLYMHMAVLVPYFDDLGQFQILVFESTTDMQGNEHRVVDLAARYKGEYIHLVAIDIIGPFQLTPLK